MSRVEATVATNDGQPLAQPRVFIQSVGSPLGARFHNHRWRGRALQLHQLAWPVFRHRYRKRATAGTVRERDGGHRRRRHLRPAAADASDDDGERSADVRRARAVRLRPAGRRIPFRQLGGQPALGGPTITATAATGTFTLTGLTPGRYQIGGPLGFGPTADTMTWALKSVVVDDADITDRILEVTGDTPPKNIVVTYTDQFQELSGRLQSQSGAPASDYTMLVFPEVQDVLDPRQPPHRHHASGHRRQVHALRGWSHDAAAGAGLARGGDGSRTRRTVRSGVPWTDRACGDPDRASSRRKKSAGPRDQVTDHAAENCQDLSHEGVRDEEN